MNVGPGIKDNAINSIGIRWEKVNPMTNSHFVRVIAWDPWAVKRIQKKICCILFL